MKKAIRVISILIVVLAFGSVVYYIMGDINITSSGQVVKDVFRGSVSILGSENHITVQTGSDIDVITLLGNDNIVIIEEGADVKEVRGGGLNNQVIAPDGMEIKNSLLDAERTTAPSTPPPQQESRPLDGL